MSPERQPEQLPSIYNPEKTGLLENIRNAAQNRLAIAGIGLVAALGANEIAKADSQNKAETPNIEATASGLKQDCIKSGLIAPQVSRAVMKNPGRNSQMIIVEAKYPAYSSECEGNDLLRVTQGKVQMQNYKNKRWTDVYKGWVDMRFGNNPNRGFMEFVTPSHAGEGDIGKNWFYKCTPGKRTTKVRALLKNKVVLDKPRKVHNVPGQPGLHTLKRPILGQKILNKPVKVNRPC